MASHSFLIPDVLYHIRQHLPFVDRRELSLVCREFREPLQEVFRKYMELSRASIDENVYVVGYFMLWVTTSFTPSTVMETHPEILVTEDIAAIERFIPTNLLKVIYYKGHLYAKNWMVLLRREAIIVCDPTLVINKYSVDASDIEDTEWFKLSVLDMNTKISGYANLGYRLIGRTDNLIHYHNTVRRLIGEYASGDKRIATVFVMYFNMFERTEYSTSLFLEASKN